MSNSGCGIVIHPSIPRGDAALVARFQEHDVAKISDSMAKYGSFHSIIKPLRDGMRVCGFAQTVQCVPGDMHALDNVLDLIQPGDVVVVDACGHETLAVAGAEICEKLARAHAGGLVVNGTVRDRLAIFACGLPVFARNVSAKCLFTKSAVSVNVPVDGGGLVVYPGDLIVGDDDGVVAVPYYDLERVIGLTDAKLAKELSNQAKINAGAVMTELYGCEAKIDKWREPKNA